MLQITIQMLFLRKQLLNSTLTDMLLVWDQGICVCTTIILRPFFKKNCFYSRTSVGSVNTQCIASLPTSLLILVPIRRNKLKQKTWKSPKIREKENTLPPPKQSKTKTKTKMNFSLHKEVMTAISVVPGNLRC